MAFGKDRSPSETLAGASDPAVAAVREAARAAQLARLSVFTARLDMDPDLWAFAIHQVEQNGYALEAWTVDQGVAWPVFRKT